jgi:hypothetical protein
MMLDVAKVTEVSRVGKGVEVHDPRLGMMQEEANKVRSDETGSAGKQYPLVHE